MKEFWNQVKAFEEVDTGKAQPLFHTYPVINIYREDTREEAFEREIQKLKTVKEGEILPVFEEEETKDHNRAAVVKRLEDAGAQIRTGRWDAGIQSGFLLGMEGNAAFSSEVRYSGGIAMKPTAGLVSRYGLEVVFPSLDSPAFGAFMMDTLAEVLEAAAGLDEKDPWSKDAYLYDFTSALKEDVKGMKIAVPLGALEGLREKEDYEAWLAFLAEHGVLIEEVELMWNEYYEAVHQVVFYTEAAAFFDGHTTEPCYEEYAQVGNELLSPENYEKYYLKALKIKTLIKEELDLLFREYDVLFVPEAVDAKEDYLLAANLCGLPFLSISHRAPVSILAGANEEKKLIRMGCLMEKYREV